MPRGDGTGPAGLGPMTGRGAGYCSGFTVPGYANILPRAGFANALSRGSYVPYYRGGYIRINPVRQAVPARPYYGYAAGYRAVPRLGLGRGRGRGRGIRGPGRGRGRFVW